MSNFMAFTYIKVIFQTSINNENVTFSTWTVKVVGQFH